jgi:tetraacyldisaccharide-1-P 4'-kinase
VEWLTGKRALVVCAIGNPGAFIGAAARAIGSRPAATMVLRDHDPYDDLSIRLLEQAAAGVDVVLTTEKDYSKLAGRLGGVACPVVRPRLAMRFERGGEGLEELVKGVARRGPAGRTEAGDRRQA